MNAILQTKACKHVIKTKNTHNSFIILVTSQDNKGISLKISLGQITCLCFIFMGLTIFHSKILLNNFSILWTI